MKVAIWGGKDEAKFLGEECIKSNLADVVCFIDNRDNIIVIENIPTINPRDINAILSQDTYIILAIRNGYSINCVLDQLEELDISRERIIIMKLSTFDYDKHILSLKESQFVWLMELKKIFLPYLQVIVTNQCNLNCKGCTHFANIYNKTKDSNEALIDELERDLYILSKTTQIFRLRILGGEPLLYKELKKLLYLARGYFSEADIRVVTNGVLIPNLNADLLKSIKENNIGLDISLYPPIRNYKDKIETTLSEHDINYDFEGVNYIEKFWKNLDFYHYNEPNESYEKCLSKQCRTLYKGKLYKCPFDAFKNKYIKYFKLQTKSNDDGYEINDDIQYMDKIYKRLYKKPSKACSYCSPINEVFYWENEIEPKESSWQILTDAKDDDL